MKISNRHAVEAQVALNRLLSLDLPLKISYDLANLALVIDEQVMAFSRGRDQLVKDYKIKLSIGEGKGTVSFSIPTDVETEDDYQAKEAAVAEFTDKMNELALAYGVEVEVKKVKLPSSLVIKAETIKPLLPFIEMEDASAS